MPGKDKKHFTKRQTKKRGCFLKVNLNANDKYFDYAQHK